MSRFRPALMGTTLVLLTALAYAGGSVIPEVGQTSAPRQTASSGLNNPKEAEAAIANLVAQGSRGTETLAQLATGSDDLSVRGRAIAGLAQARGRLAGDTLEELLTDDEALVRTWAFAAKVGRVDTLEDLAPLQHQQHAYPGSARPIELKAKALMQGANSRELLDLMGRQPQLAAAAASLLVDASPRDLARLMRTDDTDPVRRSAASILATQGQNGKNEQVAAATLSGLRFNSTATQVPWKGGALYIPGIQWDRQSAKALISELERWDRFCASKGLAQERNQIRNNLQSVNLRRAAGQ